jgi:hypothetical protein
MKTNYLKVLLVTLTGLALLMTSCEKVDPEPEITANNLKGMFVVCEGGFGKANGDISFRNAGTNQMVKNLYSSVNGHPLGDIVQSFEIVDTLGFIAVNNSQKVTVVNMKDFKTIKSISGFSYPRSIVRSDKNSVYVSNGNGYSGNFIYKIDLKTLTKTDSLAVTTGPEKLIAVNSRVYAAIAGGWNNDGKTVLEIDPATFKVLNTFTVASVPVDLVADKNNNVWAFCKGEAKYDANWNATYSNMGICKINVSTKEVTTFALSSMSASGLNNLAVSRDGGTVYFLNDGLYAMPVNSTALPTAKLVSVLYYGMDTDPQSGNILCLDAIASKAVVYNTSGTEQFSFETATYPNSVLFSY